MPQGGRGGMTLRDYFAGQVLAGLGAGLSCQPEQISKFSYIIADAMIEARK